MTAISTAVDLNRVSAITGYEIKALLEGIAAGNLPQRIGVLAEANNANQSELPDSINFTTAKEVAEVAGYGSPADLIARILRPISGDLLGSIETIIYPVEEAAGATHTTRTIAISGTATKNTTHKVIIAGRDQVDGDVYSFAVAKDDTAAEIAPKINDAVNAVLRSPVAATLATNDSVLTTKWAGLTSAEIVVTVDVGDDAAGLSYAISDADGAGEPSVSTALGNVGDEWTTILINGLNANSTVLDALESWNGNVNDRTGRYEPTFFKPLVALSGSVATTLTALTSITDSRKNEMTNVICPAPGSSGFSFEAAANVAFLYAKLVQDTPHKDPIGLNYPDMPASAAIGDFSDPTKRDQIVKVGCSTVVYNSGEYKIVDLVTTYHPTDEPATATLFRWVRDLVGIDFNIKYGYKYLYELYVEGKTLVKNDSESTADEIISPNRWKSELYDYADDLEDRALIEDAQTMKDTLQVQKGETNPSRLETTFKVERTGVARIGSATVLTTYKFV